MSLVAIIQARMSSSRLPGKALKDLGGQTVLGRVVDRVHMAKLPERVVVATSDEPCDDVIVEECERLSVEHFRGNEGDVLDRYYHAAQTFKADAVVRITADCPLIDPELIDETILAFRERNADYATNALVVTYPRGLDVEVFTSEALAKAWTHAKEPYERVHVTPYFYENPDLFNIVSLSAERNYGDYRWTLDTAEDLEMIRRVYAHFGQRRDVGWHEVLRLMESEPELAGMNSHVRQKMLHEG